MPKRSKYSKKRPVRQRNVKKQKRFTKKAARRYVSPRAMAIQRADFSPQTKLVEFVMDETYYLVPNATSKTDNTHGISLKLGTPFAPYAIFGGTTPGSPAHPFWGANDQSKNARLSGAHLTYADWNMPGTERWIGHGPAPYESGIAIGFDIEIRAEQATRSVTQDSAVSPDEMVRSIAMCGRIGKSDGKFQDITVATSPLSVWQSARKTRQVNMTVDPGYKNTASGPSKNNAQQAYMRFKGSCKKIFGFNDYKDVRDKYGINGNPTSSSQVKWAPRNNRTYTWDSLTGTLRFSILNQANCLTTHPTSCPTWSYASSTRLQYCALALTMHSTSIQVVPPPVQWIWMEVIETKALAPEFFIQIFLLK